MVSTRQYFKDLRKDVDKIYSLSQKARKKNLDPVPKVEIPLAMTMAEKVVGLVSVLYPQIIDSGIDKRILNLEKKYGKLDPAVAFKIAEEVAKQKFCKFESLLKAIDAGIRIGFAYITIGVVASPLEGYTELKLGKTKDGKEYFKVYFSGPIRSAGTTASCLVLMLIDYLRELFGYAKYDPTEEEIKRYVTENHDYHERITNLQYFPLDKEMTFLAENLPIQIAGEPTTKREVSNYKNLDRVDTDYIRGGMCLIFSEGLAQKAAKGFRLYNETKEKGIKMEGFDFLEDYLELHEKLSSGKSSSSGDSRPTYIRDLVAGRPVFGHPSESGAFRFRYGRSRVDGFSAASLHPATMAITDDFIAIGTQLKIEKPTKGCAIASCDSIEGPIVKLNNGTVKKLRKKEEAKKLYGDVEEIIYSGDILFPFSDLVNRNYDLIKPGYVQEWWKLDLREKDKKAEKGIDCFNVSLNDAIKLSKELGVPLHPDYIFYWNQITKKQFLGLIDWLKKSKVTKKIILPYTKKEREKFSLGKRALELLGIEHKVSIENVIIDEISSKSLFANLGLDLKHFDLDEKDVSELMGERDFDLGKNVLQIVNILSNFNIKDKSGDFIGTRMGRPEKAKLRKLRGSPNVLFPIGDEGGRLRSVQKACEVGKVRTNLPLFYCKACKKETIYPSCDECGKKTVRRYYFPETKEKSFDKIEKWSDEEGRPYCRYDLDINEYFKNAVDKLEMGNHEVPVLIKGVRGISSETKEFEHLSKGILRAKYDLQVNKDGTIRFDATELPLISFKPKEVSVSVKKLNELGYSKDINGKRLVNDDQILELKPHDVLLPSCYDSPNERADDVFIRISEFVDEELEKFYGLKPFYNVKTKEDLVGHLGVCMAPHNCAGVICRIIGFSNTQGLLASPFMHAAIRRDCFDYETYIPIKKDGFWRNVKIGEIVENLNPKKVVDAWGTKEKKVSSVETIGFDKIPKNVMVNNFTKHTKRKMFEIKTALGKKIKVTENHKFLINGKIKRASNLKIGDKIPLPIKINIGSEKEISSLNIFDFLDEKNLMVRKINKFLAKMKKSEKESILSKLKISKKQFRNYKFRDSYPAEFVLNLNLNLKKEIFKKGRVAIKRDNVDFPIIINFNKNLLELIGLYVAEGYSRSVKGKKGLNQVYISSDKKETRDFIKRVIKKNFGLKPSENKKDRVTFSSKLLYLFFTKILESGSNAHDKRVPYLFFNMNLDKLGSFLRGYFEGDGSVSRSDRRVTCDSVSEGLLSDLEFCLNRFGIVSKRYEYEKYPGQIVKDFYIMKKRKIPKFKITKLIIGSDFVKNFGKIGFLSKRKNKILKYHLNKKGYGMRIDKDKNFVYDPVVSVDYIGEKESYCLNVDTQNHLVSANSMMTKNCDGDEAALMLLGDVLINFSRKFLPSHRGGTQDAPLVLNAKINAGEVDDQILDLEYVPNNEYPLELYQLAEKREHSSKVEKVRTCKKVLSERKNPFKKIGFTHDTSNFNKGVTCSAYKKLATMQEKLQHQMELVEKLRAADTSDTARLVIERHFLRDLRGNLRKFSMQGFRCVKCNEKLRRPPLKGVCPRCNGKVIFTIHEGGIKKYLEPALELAEKYHLSPYVKQSLQLTKEYIEDVFGKELEKQESIDKWF